MEAAAASLDCHGHNLTLGSVVAITCSPLAFGAVVRDCTGSYRQTAFIAPAKPLNRLNGELHPNAIATKA